MLAPTLMRSTVHISSLIMPHPNSNSIFAPSQASHKLNYTFHNFTIGICKIQPRHFCNQSRRNFSLYNLRDLLRNRPGDCFVLREDGCIDIQTTTLYKLHLGEVVTTNPTVGSNVEELVYKNIRFEVWDLGGQERLRTSWATYYRGTHAVIVVIDSSDRARISIMKDELFRLLGHEDLQQSVILVFANKQDLKDAMAPAEITDALSLHSIKNHDWHIQACSALSGEGLYDGLGWIAQHVTGKAPT
ncbi:hypothetical protein L6164_025743 [Bauhinia variegata]|uniref:Uncharacterized protein n=1 Tax=Bauhinia variegata TaxID=167791 RepID=A0ACB9M4Z1_BAUVA|nr:hypothetical protein L6164_025743 [Bauhinia variegata]